MGTQYSAGFAIGYEHRYITLRKSLTLNGKTLYYCKYCRHITPYKVKGSCSMEWTLDGYIVYDALRRALTTPELEEDIRTS